MTARKIERARSRNAGPQRATKGVATTKIVRGDDIREFFDRLAADYADQHGNPGRQLAYRAELIRTAAALTGAEAAAEICCGTGDHLFALADSIRTGIGVDFSPAMVRVAQKRVGSPGSKLSFHVDDATVLRTLPDSSLDVIFCVGSLEHIPNKAAVFEGVFRALKPGGRFVCLTVNGGYAWHRRVGPALRISTRHLSSDHFIDRREARSLAVRAGFPSPRIRYWSFVPRGDMPPALGTVFSLLDLVGRLFGIGSLRGGLLVAVRRVKRIAENA